MAKYRATVSYDVIVEAPDAEFACLLEGIEVELPEEYVHHTLQVDCTENDRIKEKRGN